MESLTSLIDHLKHSGVLSTPTILRAFEKINRKEFVPKNLRDSAYADIPLPIGSGQTISQPFTVAFMLELLAAQSGDRVLDVGSGSGYTTALLAEIVGPTGVVTGVEIIEALVRLGKNNLAKFHFPYAEIRKAGNALGLPEQAPFDKILVSAGAEELPTSLVAQLKIGGRMVIPIGDAIWSIEKKSDGSITTEKYKGFAFVPLIENSGNTS